MRPKGDQVRVRSPEALAPVGQRYETSIKRQRDWTERQQTGKLLIRPEEREWEVGRMGRNRYYLHPKIFSDTAMQDWSVFTVEALQHSGKHKHQGGLTIYILDGRGYTIIDGERVDWEAGDVLMLPLRPGGTEHQHFNLVPGEWARWIAFIFLPFYDWGASEIIQMDTAPIYKEATGSA